MTLQELLEKRNRLIAQSRALLEKAEKDSPGYLDGEDKEQYERMWKDIQGMGEQIDARVKQEKLEERLNESLDDPERPDPEEGDGQPPSGGDDDPQFRGSPTATREYRDMFRRYLSRGEAGLQGEEQRAVLQADSDSGGAYLVAPEQFVAEIIKNLDNLLWIRQYASTETIGKAARMGRPTLEADPSDADWTAEIGEAQEDTEMEFGKREMEPHQVSKLIKVSNKLLRIALMDVERIVRERVEYKFKVTHEKAFMTGNGARKPLGLFTASDDGISTGRDISTGNAVDAVTVDGLTRAKYKLRQEYWPQARWGMHADTALQIALLKDGEGRYLWRESMRVGEPDRLLGFPVHLSAYAPNTFSASQYVAILGDFRFYKIVDALDMQVQRLVELYALTNQTGFVGRMETDGQPILEEAFVRVQLAAS